MAIESLQLRINNPYVVGFVLDFGDDSPVLKRKLINYQTSEKDQFHVVRNFDTLDALAFKFFGDSKYWWIIADINQILNPFELELGTVLLIPDLDIIKAIYL